MGPFSGRICFYVQTSQTLSRGCCIWNSFVFGLLRRDLNVYSYIRLCTCKLKHPLKWFFFWQNLFWCTNLQSLSQGCFMSNIRVEEDLLKFTKFYPFLGPKRSHPLFLSQIWILFANDYFQPNLAEIGQVVLEK